MNDVNIERAIAELRNSSRVSLSLVILGAACLIGSLYYSATRLAPLEDQIYHKTAKIEELASLEATYKREIDTYKEIIKQFGPESERLKKQLRTIQGEVDNARLTQNSILDFLVSVTDSRQVHILGQNVNWNEVKQQIFALPPGPRKDAILRAILLAWKDVPFQLGGNNLTVGFDSPGFIKYVLNQVGVEISSNVKPLSEAIIASLKKVDDPNPGDVVFFKGQQGNFGFILLSVGHNLEEHVGVGTLQKIHPLQILSLQNINTPCR